MLHILLLILKIIGIVLLVILGLLLSALLLVLLVPFRYRLDGSWHGAPAGRVRVTWLLHAVSVLAAYEKGLDITARLFGFTVFHSAFGGEKGETDEAGEADAAGTAAEDMDSQAADADGRQSDESVGTQRPADEVNLSDEETVVNAMSLETDSGRNNDAGSYGSVAEEPFEAGGGAHAADPGAEGDITEGIDLSQLPTLEEQLQQEEADTGDVSSGDTDIIDKIDDIVDWISEKLAWADKKRLWIEHFLEDPKNQKTIRLVWRQVKAVLRHILPQKAEGQIIFGFDDPATTGKLLAACSILYAMYGTKLTVTPDFENAVIDGDLRLKGRIRVGALAARAVRVLIDRNLWRMVKQVRKFLENGGK